jgi:hypothetical protein
LQGTCISTAGFTRNVRLSVVTVRANSNLDASVFRRFKVREGLNLEFRAEAFNVANTPQFANPNTTLGNAGFGDVTSSLKFSNSIDDTENRKIQLGLRLFF